MDCDMPDSMSSTISQSLLRFMSTESWCYLTNLFCLPFSFCFQYFPVSEYFPFSWLFALGNQSIEASASATVLTMDIHGWFPLGLTDLLAFQETLKCLLQHHNSKVSILPCSTFFMVQLSHPYMTASKTIALIIWTLVGKVMSLLFNMLPSLAIAFLPRRKHLLISWLQSLSTVILEPKKIKSISFHIFPIYLPWSNGTGCHNLSVLNAEF